MKYLIDTHVFLWIISEPHMISQNAHKIIQNNENELLLSTISIYEISIKTALGKLNLKRDFDEFIIDNMKKHMISPLSLNVNHTLKSFHLPDIHKDPFDRILIAQSISENYPFITQDGIIKKYPEIRVIW
jgi:PIN domain nuclease of toxin-antitoxin system